jgi:hypothetical protein
MTELVALLYRADWTRLSLSATLRWRRDHALDWQLRQQAADQRNQALGPVPRHRRPSDEPDVPPIPAEGDYRIMLATGGRYRVEAADGGLSAVSDGASHWQILDGAARRYPAEMREKFHGLVTPQWLIASYDLDITGRTEAAGRPAYGVTATPRAAASSRSSASRYRLLDRVDAQVDAELGIILRSEQFFRGQTLAVAELHDLVMNPPRAADPELFEPPPGLPADDFPWHGTFEPQGPGWQAAIIAAGAAASAMGFAVRHAPSRPPRRAAEDGEAGMPADAHDFAAVMTGLVPLSDDLINLLHRTGLPAQDFDAELHQWIDAGTALDASRTFRSALPQPVAGILGPDALWDAIGERGRQQGVVHRTARLRVSMPGRYRIDYLTGRWHPRRQAVACDGEQVSKLYPNRVAAGPARPLEHEFAALTDPAWLLTGWTLREDGEAIAGGRRGVRIVAEAQGWPGPGQAFPVIEAVVDAELGILLRHTSYVDGRPAKRSELRNVTAPARPAGFRIDAVPGVRAVTDPGGPLADWDLPAPVKAVGSAAALAAAGAVAATGWLQKRRARPDVEDTNNP